MSLYVRQPVHRWVDLEDGISGALRFSSTTVRLRRKRTSDLGRPGISLIPFSGEIGTTKYFKGERSPLSNQLSNTMPE